MNTNIRRFEILELRTMAGDALKDDVIDSTSFLEDFDDVSHVCGVERRKSAFCRTIGL